MGEKIVHAARRGQGQAVKVITNAITAINCATLAQALLVGARRPASTSTRCCRSMGGGSADSTMRDAQGPADARARLHAAVQARAHAQGRAAVPRARRRPPARRFPFAGLARGALRRRHGPRASATQDFAAVLEVVEGLAGASDDLARRAHCRKPCVAKNPRICRDVLVIPRRLCIVCDVPPEVSRSQRGQGRRAGPCAGSAGPLNLLLHLYADRFQGMGRHRARARRG